MFDVICNYREPMISLISWCCADVGWTASTLLLCPPSTAGMMFIVSGAIYCVPKN
jgi:hypothetical protein